MKVVMPRGDKSKYTDKQERKADHIAESYESRGDPDEEAERRAWATVNKESGGKKSGSGRGKPESHASSRKGGRLGGTASASRSAAAWSASAKKAAATRKRKQRKAGAWRGWAVNIPTEVFLAPMDPEDLDAAEGAYADDFGITRPRSSKSQTGGS
jgi:plasmid stabilization system protein ParE